MNRRKRDRRDRAENELGIKAKRDKKRQSSQILLGIVSTFNLQKTS